MYSRPHHQRIQRILESLNPDLLLRNQCLFGGGAAIKFEIVFEGRVELQDPAPEDRVNGVWALTMRDKVATKLMANSDRWADDSVWSRDIIDLALLANGRAADPAGVAAAVEAYGSSVLVDFEKARTSLLAREGWLRNCMRRMQMTMPEIDLRELIQGLAVALPPAPRPR